MRNNKNRVRFGVTGGVLVISLMALASAIAAGGGALWLTGGQDKSNNRNQSLEKTIGVNNVGDLGVKWQLNTAGPVSATPAVDGKNVYVPDFAGNLYAVDRDTGAIVWQKSIASYTDGAFPAVPANDFARATPAVAGQFLIFGDQGGRAALEGAFTGGPLFTVGGARVRAVDKNSGELVWSTLVDAHPAAMVTSSAAVQGDVVYLGVASYEEAYGGLLPAELYPCCTFRGSVVALDKNTGAILWKTYTVPATYPAEGPDYSGNAVWGSTPAIDPKRNSVYVATGNNYSVPDSVAQCITDAGADGGAQRACLSADNFFDSVVALDLMTGEVKWSTTVIPFDTWNVGCLEIPGLPVDPEQCPSPAGPDFDFGQAPMLYTIGNGKNARDYLAIGQKSGQMWLLDPDTGEILESAKPGVGGVAGGFIWGSATDGARVYGADANSFAAPWTLDDGTVTFSGGWVAVDPVTLDTIWQTATPVPVSPAGGAATVANGVLYGCAQTSFIESDLVTFGVPLDNMFALDAATGDILWSRYAGGSCNSGAAVVDGDIYWGFGYPGDTGAAQGSGLIALGLNP